MKASEADILIIPGYKNSGPKHWQSRWEAKLSTARRVEQHAWSKPVCEEWTDNICKAVSEATLPVVIVAHSLGVAATIKSVPKVGDRITGAFLVAPPDVANPKIRPRHLQTFGPYTRDPLPFPSIVIASRNDPFSSYDAADEAAAAWGSVIMDAGEAGHINDDSGFGPWPEGLMVFARFLSRLSA